MAGPSGVEGGGAVTGPAPDGTPKPGGEGRDVLRRLRSAVDDHPLVIVAAFAVVAAAWNLLVVHRTRRLGGFNLDEAGYLARAMGMQRRFADGGVGGFVEALPTETGPLVPSASAGLLALHPSSLLAALAVQTVFAAVAAVSVAGIVRRLAGPGSAVIAGLVVLGLPIVIVSSRGYQFGLAAAAGLAASTWALLASEGGRRRGPMLLAGAAAGAMVLSRTMTVAFLPGLVVAAWFQLRGRPRALGRVMPAALGLAVVVMPWAVLHGGDAVRYLLGNGYGEASVSYGDTPLPLRLPERVLRLFPAVRPLLLVPALVVLGAAVHKSRRQRAGAVPSAHDDRRDPTSSNRSDGEVDPSSGRGPFKGRDVAAVAAVVAGGYLALLTSRNTGTDFDLPLIVMAVALVCAAASKVAPQPRRIGAVAVAAVVLNLAAVGSVDVGSSWKLVGDETSGTRASALLFAGTEAQQVEFAAADGRFGWGSSAAERADASADWWQANVEVVWALDRAEAAVGGGSIRSVTGTVPLLSANSILLAEEVVGQGQRPLSQVDVADGPDAFLSMTEPRRNGQPNILVMIAGKRALTPQGQRVADHLAVVTGEGWVVADTVAMPDGGVVHVLLHPDST